MMSLAVLLRSIAGAPPVDLVGEVVVVLCCFTGAGVAARIERTDGLSLVLVLAAISSIYLLPLLFCEEV